MADDLKDTILSTIEASLDAQLRAEAEALNAPFLHFMRTGLPLVTFSTDMVFNGLLGRAYVEGDPAAAWRQLGIDARCFQRHHGLRGLARGIGGLHGVTRGGVPVFQADVDIAGGALGHEDEVARSRADEAGQFGAGRLAAAARVGSSSGVRRKLRRRIVVLYWALASTCAAGTL